MWSLSSTPGHLFLQKTESKKGGGPGLSLTLHPRLKEGTDTDNNQGEQSRSTHSVYRADETKLSNSSVQLTIFDLIMNRLTGGIKNMLMVNESMAKTTTRCLITA